MHGAWTRSYISTSGLKSDVTLVLLDPDFLQDTQISAIRPWMSVILRNFHCACAKQPYFHFRSKIWRHHCVPRPRFPFRRENFGDSAINTRYIAYFSLRMCEAAVFWLPVYNLTPASCSSTPISFKTREFRRFGHKWALYCVFFIEHARNGRISTSSLKSDVTIVFLDPDFLLDA